MAGVGRAAARPSSLPLVGKTLFLPLSCQRGFHTHDTALRRRKTFLLPRLWHSPPKAQAAGGPGRLHFVLSRGRRAANMEPRAGRAAGAAVAPWAGPGPQGPRGRPGRREPRASLLASGRQQNHTAASQALPKPQNLGAHCNCMSRLRRGERWQLEPPGIPANILLFAEILTPLETKLLQIPTAAMLR